MGSNVLLDPGFERKVLEVLPDGSQIVRDNLGLIVKEKPGIVSIPSEIATALTDRDVWEAEYLPRLQMHAGRVPVEAVRKLPPPEQRDIPIGIHLGSLMGQMRNLLGVEQLSYLYADDEDLYAEIVDTLCGLCYDCAKRMLETGVQFDYAHYWADICFKSGPLVSPRMFRELVGPWYRKISDLVNAHGIDIISLDCDGCIDALLPIWLENGVNTMFPMEVGTWNASIAPWREKYGKEIRGVGGMNKNVFAADYAAVDREIERLRPLVELGGYIPCPDHRIPLGAKWENIQYYCEQFRKMFQ
jgi:uroporphyrinogen decarboxylase